MIQIIFISALIFCLACIFLRKAILKAATQVRESEKIKPPYAVISVKNGEDCIEGIIRSLAWQMQAQTTDCINCINELVVIDLGSVDETYSILKKLSEEYPFVHCMNKTQYIESVSGL